MIRYEGVGIFGTILADELNKENMNLATFSRRTGINAKTVSHHIYHIHRPYPSTIGIYATYFRMPEKELEKIVCQDWGLESLRKLKCQVRGEFGKLLSDYIIEHDKYLYKASEKLGYHPDSIRRHIAMWTCPTYPCITRYANYLKMDPRELDKIIREDWRKKYWKEET